jgi:hypothetical protein
MTTPTSKTRWTWWACTVDEVARGDEEVGTETVITPPGLDRAMTGTEEARLLARKNMAISTTVHLGMILSEDFNLTQASNIGGSGGSDEDTAMGSGWR